MNEASLWRYALARQIAPHYSASPKVRTVAIAGSVARGEADRSSDIDLYVFWNASPTGQERRDCIKQAKGRRWSRFPTRRDTSGWSDEFEVGGVPIDVRHMTVEAIEGFLMDVLKHADASLAKQRHIAALLCALPLSNPSTLTSWQQQAVVYPHALSIAMVQAHLSIRPSWEREVLAERHELLELYESLCLVEKHMLLVLMGLNRLYYPGWQRVSRLVTQMPLSPLHFVSRCQQAFGIVSIDPVASVYQFHDLVEETFQLVERHLSDIDTLSARAYFRAQHLSGDHAPEGLV